jgi:hypothetical protein
MNIVGHYISQISARVKPSGRDVFPSQVQSESRFRADGLRRSDKGNPHDPAVFFFDEKSQISDLIGQSGKGSSPDGSLRHTRR